MQKYGITRLGWVQEIQEYNDRLHVPTQWFDANGYDKLGFDPTSKAGNKGKHEVAELRGNMNDQFCSFPRFARHFVSRE